MEDGFTLVELLVVISILAILSTVSLVVFTSTQQNARDTKRQSDLKLIQSALEQYHTDQNYYPPSVTMDNLLTSGGALTNPDATKTYLKKTPFDPRKDDPAYPRYKYEAASASAHNSICDNSSGIYCVDYCLFAEVENSDSGATIPGCNSGTYNYSVSTP